MDNHELKESLSAQKRRLGPLARAVTSHETPLMPEKPIYFRPNETDLPIRPYVPDPAPMNIRS